MKQSLDKKTLGAAILIAALALTLTACGDLKHTNRANANKAAGASGVGSKDAAPAAPAPTTAPSPTASNTAKATDAAKAVDKRTLEEKKAAEKEAADAEAKAKKAGCEDLASAKIDGTEDFSIVADGQKLSDAAAGAGLHYVLDKEAKMLISISNENGSKRHTLQLKDTQVVEECDLESATLPQLSEKSSLALSKILVKTDGSELEGATTISISRKDSKSYSAKVQEVKEIAATVAMLTEAGLVVGSNKLADRGAKLGIYGTVVTRSKDGKRLDVRTIKMEKEGDATYKIVTRIVLKQVDASQAK